MPLEIYRKGQGNVARTLTAVSLIAIAGFGAVEIRDALIGRRIFAAGPDAGYLLGGLFFVAIALLALWIAFKSKRSGDFLILTESELRKVSWPSKRDLWQQTIVVLVVSGVIGVIILIVDLVYSSIFRGAGIL